MARRRWLGGSGGGRFVSGPCSTSLLSRFQPLLVLWRLDELGVVREHRELAEVAAECPLDGIQPLDDLTETLFLEGNVNVRPVSAFQLGLFLDGFVSLLPACVELSGFEV